MINSVVVSFFFIALNYFLFMFLNKKRQNKIVFFLVLLFCIGMLFCVKFFYNNILIKFFLIDKGTFLILCFVSFSLILLDFIKGVESEMINVFKEKLNINMEGFLKKELVLIYIIATISQLIIIWKGLPQIK
ncbi:hypothetical protein [Flavobacterium sp. GCM10027622]|uniref:hypothetical protein n=1 Tax=unclassified Flavobacterium TaxID=196869 RepID=UPI003611CCC6